MWLNEPSGSVPSAGKGSDPNHSRTMTACPGMVATAQQIHAMRMAPTGAQESCPAALTRIANNSPPPLSACRCLSPAANHAVSPACSAGRPLSAPNCACPASRCSAHATPGSQKKNIDPTSGRCSSSACSSSRFHIRLKSWVVPSTSSPCSASSPAKRTRPCGGSTWATRPSSKRRRTPLPCSTSSRSTPGRWRTQRPARSRPPTGAAPSHHPLRAGAGSRGSSQVHSASVRDDSPGWK